MNVAATPTNGLQQHIARVTDRSRRFYAARTPGHFLVSVRLPASAPPVPPLRSFDLDRGLPQWLDAQLAAARPQWAACEGLDDDTIPAICPSFGIAEHSAWLGLDVHLQDTTCLPEPVLAAPGEFSRLRCSEQDRWYQYMKTGYDHLRGRQDGTFALSVRGGMMPMDLAHAVRGNDLYTDFYDDPDGVQRLLRFLADAERWYYRHLVSWADDVAGGCVLRSPYGWVPAGTLGHISNDASMLCAPEIYETFGLPHERELAEHFKRVVYHVHNQKMHPLPRLVTLPGLALLEVTQDPKTPRLADDLPRLLAATGQANLLLALSSDEVRRCLPSLATRNVRLDVSCRDRSDAADIIAFVRAARETSLRR